MCNSPRCRKSQSRPTLTDNYLRKGQGHQPLDLNYREKKNQRSSRDEPEHCNGLLSKLRNDNLTRQEYFLKMLVLQERITFLSEKIEKEMRQAYRRQAEELFQGAADLLSLLTRARIRFRSVATSRALADLLYHISETFRLHKPTRKYQQEFDRTVRKLETEQRKKRQADRMWQQSLKDYQNAGCPIRRAGELMEQDNRNLGLRR